MFRRKQRYRSAAERSLSRAIEDAEAVCGVALGGRVWLLPRWYLVKYHRDRSWSLAYTEVSLYLLGRPRMFLAGKVFGPVAADSGVPWSVGKGLVGLLTFEVLDFRVTQHHDLWPSNLNVMSERDWQRQPREIRLRRKLSEAQALKRLYGTVVGVPLMDPDTNAKLGCLTVHSSSDSPIPDDKAGEIAAILTAQSLELARQIVRRARLGPTLQRSAEENIK